MNTIPLKVRRAVWERSGGFCEVCGLPGANHLHHRRLRSQGGRHEPSNLLHVHWRCHERIHSRPALSYERGWMVPSWREPADVPVCKEIAS